MATIMDPDYDKCDDLSASAVQDYGARPCRCSFTGFHGGGGGGAINFVFCDGSVHLVVNTGDLRILGGLATIDGHGNEPTNQLP